MNTRHRWLQRSTPIFYALFVMLVLDAPTLGVHRCEGGGEGDHDYVEQARNLQAVKLDIGL